MICSAHNIKRCKYILNVSAPIYHSGQQSIKDFLVIEKCIASIFSEAKKKNISSIGIPVLGGGSGGFFFN